MILKKLAFVVVLAVSVTVAAAEDTTGGISVTGTGTVKGKPSQVQISGSISGEGELANDASVKYRDAKKKVIAAFDALKNPDLSIDFKGSSVSQGVDPQAQMRLMQGMGGDTGKAKVNVTEQMELVLKGADKLDNDKLLDTLFKIIDTGKDAGLQIGPPPPKSYYEMQIRAQGASDNAIVQFKIPDITTLQDEAYKLAIADARAKAEKLAELSGIKLGRVLSVQDEGAPPGNASGMYSVVMAEMNGGAGLKPATKEAVSGQFGEIPLTIRIHVLFEIQK